MLDHFRDANTGAGQDFTGLTAAVQLRLRVRVRVANFDSEVPALNRRELGAIPRQPTNSNAECGLQNAESAVPRNQLSSFRTPHSAFNTHPW